MVANGRQATQRGGAFDSGGDLVHVGSRIEGAGVFALYAQAVDGLELRAHADQVLPGHDVDVLALHTAQLCGRRTGLGLGLVEGLTRVFYPEASNIVVFVIMVIVLMIRPAGLFGKEV